MAITDKEINLSQLSHELGGKGLIADFNNLQEKIILPADGVKLTEAELKTAIDAHVAIDDSKSKEAAVQIILDRIGLTKDEVALILG